MVGMSVEKSIESEIAELIVETLNLEDVKSSDIDFDEPLFYDGLGLDSIDSLELSTALSGRYGFQLNQMIQIIKKYFPLFDH